MTDRWTPTETRRWLRREGHPDILQREWVNGSLQEWRDVPIVEEMLMDADFSDVPIVISSESAAV